MHLKLTIAYDGSPFAGWQIQPNAETIQERIEKALAEVAKEPLRLHGSGRTDAGVHLKLSPNDDARRGLEKKFKTISFPADFKSDRLEGWEEC